MKNQIRTCLKRFGIIPLIWLCGCASPVALDKDYDNYAQVYGDAVNRQLLLNLARESQGDPAYFLQLGSIQSQYSINTAASFSPSYVFRHTPAGISGQAQLGLTQSPNFQFLPLTGSNYVQAVLTPVSDKVFWTLFDQGWPANWLIRTMTESITRTSTNSTTGTTNVEVFENDPSDPTYPQFLTYCDGIFRGQLLHTLVMKKNPGVEKEVFESTNSKAYKLSEIVGAISNGLLVIWTNGGPVVKTKSDGSFELATNASSNLTAYKAYIGKRLIFPKQETFDYVVNFNTNLAGASITFKMRTFESILNSVASEESSFSSFVPKTNRPYRSKDISFTTDPCGAVAVVKRPDGSSFTNRPILTISDKKAPGFSKLINVQYKGAAYAIGDYTNGVEDVISGYQNQNREVFTLLSYLFSQVAIDTSKLPVQQLIQVQ